MSESRIPFQTVSGEYSSGIEVAGKNRFGWCRCTLGTMQIVFPRGQMT